MSMTTPDSARTYAVRRTVSSRVGHTDFRNSLKVSLKNSTGLPRRIVPRFTILELGPFAAGLAKALSHLSVDFMTAASGAELAQLEPLGVVAPVL